MNVKKLYKYVAAGVVLGATANAEVIVQLGEIIDAGNSSVTIDLNGDSIDDFRIDFTANFSSQTGSLIVTGNNMYILTPLNGAGIDARGGADINAGFADGNLNLVNFAATFPNTNGGPNSAQSFTPTNEVGFVIKGSNINAFDTVSSSNVGFGNAALNGLGTNTVALVGAVLGNGDTAFLQFRNGSVILDGGAFEVGGGTINLSNVNIAAVPEPSTFSMLALGAAGVAALRYRRRKKQTISPDVNSSAI